MNGKILSSFERIKMETIANSKGQIRIPSKIRKQLGITDGTYLHVEVDAVTKKIILTPITREYIRGLRGKYKGKGLMKALMSEKNEQNL
ncbi:MAG: AbrB/MazE/SpoVT family DNA-binding domain-containing protein [Methylomicrobium sp.]|nr:AbrB/MazE/SpoVT family DNA-binding domain-containing protein [Methylomicrobium sp.]